MIIKQFLYDLRKWEVVVVGEKSSDDKRIGLYDSEEEAQKTIEKELKNL